MRKLFLIPAFLFYFSFSALCQTQLIQNGDFSNLGSNWSILGSYWFVSGSFTCYSTPTAYAFTGTASGGGANNTNGSINQAITIPANALSATLTFKTSINTDETTTTTVFDVLQVQLRDPSLNLLYSFAQYSNLDGARPSTACQVYQTRTFSVPSTYFGRPLLLNFQTASDAASFTKFRIDDVSLTYQPCALPIAPTGLTATPISSSQINLSWNNVSGATMYEVDYNQGQCPWTGGTATIIQTASNTLSITGLNSGTPYRFIVITRNSCGWGTTFSCVSAATNTSVGSVNVTLNPSGAVSAGAQWNLDGGSWQNSGTTLSGISVGNHTVNFKSISGWTSPPSQNINVTNGSTSNLTGTYTQTAQFGSVNVTLNPSTAVNAGAQWNLDGGSWQNSGTTLNNVSTGSHSVNFNSISGWTSPVSQNISIIANNTTNATGTYTLSVSPPTVNSITFTNDIENHNGITPLFTLYSGSPFATNNPIKICADGSTATYFKVNVSNTSGINFQILDESGNVVANTANNFASDPAKFGQMGTPYTFGGSNVEVSYTHPQYMDANAPFKTFTLQITYNGNLINNISFPLNIYRAPVLFIHGLWGNTETFLEMEDYLIANNLYPPYTNILNYTYDSHSQLTFRGDYTVDNAKSFSSNAIYMYLFLYKVFNRIRNFNFSAGKVDVICHSMGGVLARLYLQNDNNVIHYKIDIHKLITLNTPHYGTQVANYILGPNGGNIILALEEIMHYSCDQGAVNDLQYNSNAISQHLNISQSSQINKVPSNTIYTEGFNSSDFEANTVHVILKDAINTKDIFNGEMNDLIVPLSSQKAGIDLSLPLISGQWHVGSSKNIGIKVKVMNLINSNPNDPSHFTNSGFVKSTLTMSNLRVSENNQRVASNTDSIKIVNIVTNQNIYSNDSVDVNVEATGSISRIVFLAGNQFTTPYSKDSLAQSVIFGIRIPANAIGKYNLCAIGYNSGNSTAIDTVSVNIINLASIDSITCNKIDIDVPVGFQTQLTVKGYFNDGTIRDISNLSQLLYSTDASIVKHIGNSVLSGIAEGNTFVTASYQGKSTQINVHVYSDTSLFKAGFSSDNIQICTNDSILFRNESTSTPTSLLWQFTGGVPSTSILQNPIVTYHTPGTYSVTLIASYPGKTDTLLISNYITINQKNKTISSGNWNDPTIWSCSSVPSLNDSVVVASGHSVTLNTSSQIRKLNIENNGSVTLNDSTLTITIGAELNKTSPVICNGSMLIDNGNMKINGNLSLTNTSHFNMKGGKLTIDGNTGQLSTSIPDGVHLFDVTSSAANFSFSGGTIQFINPPLGINSQTINCSNNFGLLSTVSFGDGVSTIVSNNPNGFGGNLLPAQMGKFILDAATQMNNRVFKNLNPLIVNKECKVISGKLIQGALLKLIDSIPTVTDIDGNHYSIVTICDQDWTATNLNVSHYRNGDTIPEVQDPTAWSSLTTGAWCYYQNNTINGTVYGKLYNWYAVNDPRGLAPLGWHVPADGEWITLTTCLGGESVAGGKMKATTLWNSPNVGATNSSGFTGLPGGLRTYADGSCNVMGYYGYWRSATESDDADAWSYYINNASGDIIRVELNKNSGYSVRCIKD